MEREKCCCFTGHRRIPEQEMLWVRRRLREEILDLAQKGVDTFLTGGALGFDTLAAQEVLRMRAMGLPSLKLVLALPYMNQEAQWSQRDAAVYRTLLRQADNVVYTSQEYHRGCLFQRNRYLVDHSAYCVCYLLQSGPAPPIPPSTPGSRAWKCGTWLRPPGSSSPPPQRPRKTAAPGREGSAFPGRAIVRLWGFTKVME
ncbi:MAG: SLOG family protein [Acutalibacter sp.]